MKRDQRDVDEHQNSSYGPAVMREKGRGTYMGGSLEGLADHSLCISFLRV